MWLMPLRDKPQLEKEYFYYVLEGQHTQLKIKELDNMLVDGQHIRNIMDFADCSYNQDFAILSVELTDQLAGQIEFADAPELKEKAKKVAEQKSVLELVLAGKKKIQVTKENIEVKDGGILTITTPETGAHDFNFGKLWDSIEAGGIDKMAKGDKVTLQNDKGENIVEITGGNFLSLVGVDIEVLDVTKLRNKENPSFFDRAEALKGGLYVRKDGTLDIGNIQRTFYMQINVKNLLLSALSKSLSLTEATQKLIETKAKPATKKRKK